MGGLVLQIPSRPLLCPGTSRAMDSIGGQFFPQPGDGPFLVGFQSAGFGEFQQVGFPHPAEFRSGERFQWLVMAVAVGLDRFWFGRPAAGHVADEIFHPEAETFGQSLAGGLPCGVAG